MANQPTKYSKFLVGAASAALVATAVAPVASAADFKDTKGNTHEEAIKALSAAGVISGYADGTFKPNKTLTRSDVVKMMGKWLVSEGYKVPTDYKTNVRFTDLKSTSNDELLQYAAVVKDNGVFIGSNDRLLAGEDISRENMAVVIVRAFDRVHDIDLASYVAGQDFKKDVTDLGKAKAEARPAIDVLDFFDITNPAAPVFNPKSTTTRGQFASFLNKTLNADFSKVTGQVAAGVASITAINATTVEVAMKDVVSDINSLKFTINGLTVSNAAVKQTDSKVVILTTAVQKGGEKYTVTLNEKAIGSFTGVSSVLPEAVSMITTSQQGVVGKEVTVSAQVTVAKDESKAGIPVTFNVVSSNRSINKDHVVEVKTNADGIAEYSYTQYAAGEDNVQAYATGKANVRSNGKVYWATALQLTVDELTTGNDLANETKKSYKVTGTPKTTYYIAIKENIDVAPDKITNVKVQNHGTQNFVTPYELTTGATSFATVTTNEKGEGSFTVYGSDLTATPIVYLPSSVGLKTNFHPSALKAQAPAVKFSRVDRLALTVAGEGTADSAEYTSVPVAYDTNSAGGRMYTATVTDKDGKIAPVGSTAYVTFETGNVSGDVYFTTDTKNFVKVVANTAYPITVGKDGKAQFRVAGKGATSFAKPTVFLNTGGSTTDVKLDAGDIKQVADVTYFKSPIVTNAILKVTDLNGRVISSINAGTDAYFTYQSVDQNGFEYRPGNYTVTEGTTTTIYVQVVQPDGTITFVPKQVTVDSIMSNNYVLAFDVTSTFGNAVVKDANGVTLPVVQNLGNTKTYHVNSNTNGKAIVRVSSVSADTVSVNVTGASNILPTQTASVTFVNTSQVPSAYTGQVQSFNTQKNTLKFFGKDAVELYGANTIYTVNNGSQYLSPEQFTSLLKNATGSVTLTRTVNGDQVRIDVIGSSNTGTKPVDETGTLTDQQTANNVATQINALPATGSLTLADKAIVSSARAAFNALTVAQQALVTDAAKDKLVAAEAKIVELEGALPEAITLTSANAVAGNDVAWMLGMAPYEVEGTVAKAADSKVVITFNGLQPGTTTAATQTVDATVDASGKFTATLPAGTNYYTSVVAKVVKADGTNGKTVTADIKRK